VLTEQQQLEAINLWNTMFRGIWFYWLAAGDDDPLAHLRAGKSYRDKA